MYDIPPLRLRCLRIKCKKAAEIIGHKAGSMSWVIKYMVITPVKRSFDAKQIGHSPVLAYRRC